MDGVQLSLFTDYGDPKDSTIVVERKAFIQPFERVLAFSELRGLLEIEHAPHIFADEAPDYITLDPATKEKWGLLKKRLAYFQKISGTPPQIPDQVFFEISDNLSLNIESLIDGAPELEHLLSRRKLRYGVHDLHEYRGKFFPQLVRSLINAAGLKEGGVVLDPMCGSGTTNTEARVLGMQTLGLDLNPLSVLIGSYARSNK